MKTFEATEQAYKNGYEAGKRDAGKKGRWVDRYGGKYANKCYDCSECKGTALYKPEADELGHWRFVQALSDNCPHCGADMRGEEMERSEGDV